MARDKSPNRRFYYAQSTNITVPNLLAVAKNKILEENEPAQFMN